mmetsp:Transcript_65839/g.104463  ORF Transcript_65839/g.104463 Transcript_65839/m.104463 type:complete len:311 (+) Transcript_65839:1410-2342(+)
MAHAIICNRVGVHHRSTSSCNHGPNTALLIEDRQFQGCTRSAIHVSDQCFLRIGCAAKGRWPIKLSPFLRNEEVGSLIKFCCHIQGHHGVVIQHDQRIDFQVCKVQVSVELVQTANERGHASLLCSCQLGEQLLGHHSFCQGLTCGNFQTLSFCIHITDIHPTFMVKENFVMVAMGKHANVVFLFLLVRHKRFDEEVRQLPSHMLDFLLFAHSVHDPLLCLVKSLVHRNQASLATALDELIWLGHQIGGLQPGVLLQELVPTAIAGGIQYGGGHENSSMTHLVLAPRNLWQQLLQQSLARMLPNRLHGHG